MIQTNLKMDQKTTIKFKPDRLCCEVKKIGKCKKCNHPVCDEHMVECADCGTACFECSSANDCSECGVSVCRFCMIVSVSKKLICTTCNTSIFDTFDHYGPDDFGGNDYYDDSDESIYPF